jgi:hypothetical protein
VGRVRDYATNRDILDFGWICAIFPDHISQEHSKLIAGRSDVGSSAELEDQFFIFEQSTMNGCVANI